MRSILDFGATKKVLFYPLTIGVFIPLFAPFAAKACPTWENGYGGSFYAPTHDLDSGVSSRVVAGGEEDLSECRSVPGVGHVTHLPDFTTYIVPSTREAIVFEASGDCDLILLVNTANENWFFDDDDGVPYGGDARIVLTRPSTGRYDLWVGTFGAQYCDATIKVSKAPLNETRGS